MIQKKKYHLILTADEYYEEKLVPLQSVQKEENKTKRKEEVKAYKAGKKKNRFYKAKAAPVYFGMPAKSTEPTFGVRAVYGACDSETIPYSVKLRGTYYSHTFELTTVASRKSLPFLSFIF